MLGQPCWQGYLLVGDSMSLEEKVQALAEVVSGMLATVSSVAPVNHREHLRYLQQTLSEILEDD